MTTVIRFKNWNFHQKAHYGILVQPAPRHFLAWDIEEAINAQGKVTYTADLPHEDSYTIFWLPERATDEQMQAVIKKLVAGVTV